MTQNVTLVTVTSPNGSNRIETPIGTAANPVVTASGTGTNSSQVQGNVASGATDSGNPVKVAGVYNATLPTLATGQRGDIQVDSNGNQRAVNVASSTANAGMTPVTALNSFGIVVKASPGNFYGGSVIAGATAGFLIAYNATTVPAAGATLTAGLILGAVSVSANGSAAIGEYNIADRFSVGVVLLFSTTLATNTNPANASVFIRGRAA